MEVAESHGTAGDGQRHGSKSGLFHRFARGVEGGDE